MAATENSGVNAGAECSTSVVDEIINKPRKRPRCLQKEAQIRIAKVQGKAHTNHRGKAVAARSGGPDCR